MLEVCLAKSWRDSSALEISLEVRVLVAEVQTGTIIKPGHSEEKNVAGLYTTITGENTIT